MKEKIKSITSGIKNIIVRKRDNASQVQEVENAVEIMAAIRSSMILSKWHIIVAPDANRQLDALCDTIAANKLGGIERVRTMQVHGTFGDAFLKKKVRDELTEYAYDIQAIA